MECKNCCYFAQTENKEWNGIEHCCFHEWGHTDDEIAPCDYEEYDYDFDYEREM